MSDKSSGHPARRACAGTPPSVAPDTRDPDRVARLARLLPIPRSIAADTTVAGRQRLVRLIERALRAERARGKAGHWTYDLARHAALRRVLDEERSALAATPARAAEPPPSDCRDAPETRPAAAVPRRPEERS